jgi:hypothetical protein
MKEKSLLKSIICVAVGLVLPTMGVAQSPLPMLKRLSDHRAGVPVTTNPTFDGLGAQFMRIAFSLAYAELTGSQFLYRRFEGMDHNYNEDDDYLKKKEWITNLIGVLPEVEEKQRFKVLGDHEWKNFFAGRMDLFSRTRALRLLRTRFWVNKKKFDFLDPHRFHIAVHIRRFNSHDTRTAGTDVPDSVFLKNIEILRSRYVAREPLVHIFSQGDEASFAGFMGPDTILHLNTSVEDTFCSMAMADVLCTSPSALSYSAALLSRGEVYYHPYPYAEPLPHWRMAYNEPMQKWF